MQRSIDVLPKQGPRPPWRLYQNYIRDVRMLRHGAMEDDAIVFSRRPQRQATVHPFRKQAARA